MHVQAELVSSVTSFVPGQPFDVALLEKIDSGWHTYWKNAGDAGAPTRLKWQLPDGFSAGDIQWPWPRRITYGPLMDYGYEDQVLLRSRPMPGGWCVLTFASRSRRTSA